MEQFQPMWTVPRKFQKILTHNWTTTISVDGVWSDWGEPSACSVTCGEGIISYTRECTPPQNGGAECVGDATKTEKCPIIGCPG